MISNQELKVENQYPLVFHLILNMLKGPRIGYSNFILSGFRMEKRMLSLIFLAHASDVLENAFAPLNDDDYDVAMKRVRDLLDLDLEAEAAKEKTNEVMWAVFAAFIK